MDDWVRSEHAVLAELFSRTPNAGPAFRKLVEEQLSLLRLLEHTVYTEDVPEGAMRALKISARNGSEALLFAHKTLMANRKKEVDSPLKREIKREVKFLDDLSFLDENSWPKRVKKLRETVTLQAGDRYISDTLKEMPEVRKYLNL